MNLTSRSHILTTIPGKSLNAIHVLKLNLLPVPSPQQYTLFLIAYVATTGNNASFWHFEKLLSAPFTALYTLAFMLTVILSLVLTKDRVHILTSQYPTRCRPPSLGCGTNGIIFATLKSHKKSRIYPNKSVSFFRLKDLYHIKKLGCEFHFKRWGISSNPDCTLCLNPETLLHVVAGCQSYLDRFTWRHNSILNFLAQTLQSGDGYELFTDLPGFKNHQSSQEKIPSRFIADYIS